jgi:hypothetical protein
MFHSREAALSKIELARQAVRDHQDESNRAIADRIGVSHMTVARARNMKDVPVEHADVPPMPESWALAGINTDVLRQLQERPPLGAALDVLRMAAETGELDRDALAEVVAIRWDLKPGDRMQYDDGRLFREKARPRRTVRQRAG